MVAAAAASFGVDWTRSAAAQRPDDAAREEAYHQLWPLAANGDVAGVRRLIRDFDLGDIRMSDVALARAYNVSGDPQRAVAIAVDLDVTYVAERKVELLAQAADIFVARRNNWREAVRACDAALSAADEIIELRDSQEVAIEALEQLSRAVQLRAFAELRDNEAAGVLAASDSGRARLLAISLREALAANAEAQPNTPAVDVVVAVASQHGSGLALVDGARPSRNKCVQSAGLSGLSAYLAASPTLTEARIEALPSTMWDLVGRDFRTVAPPLADGVRQIAWLPTAQLGLLPLALAQDPDTGRFLLDDYEISQAPSKLVFDAARTKVQGDARPIALAGAFNPTGDLHFAELEGRLVQTVAARPVASLGPGTLADAALGAIRDATVWHFATHATFDLYDARNASMLFARDASDQPTRLTMNQILDLPTSNGPRLVFLSACDTGLVETRRTPEEFSGLPTAFLQAGAAGVVATLWPVDDLATSLVAARFYDGWLNRGATPAAALRSAQIWLRDATNDDVASYLESLALTPDEQDTLLGLIYEATTERPFSHPKYWGGFFYVGA